MDVNLKSTNRKSVEKSDKRSVKSPGKSSKEHQPKPDDTKVTKDSEASLLLKAKEKVTPTQKSEEKKINPKQELSKKSMPPADFASLSLQNRLKDFTIEGNESLLVSPRSGQLKYRSQIGKDTSDDSGSSDSEDSESDDDCKIVAVESPKEPKSRTAFSESKDDRFVASSKLSLSQKLASKADKTQGETSHQVAPPKVTSKVMPEVTDKVIPKVIPLVDQKQGQKVLTFKNEAELQQYLKEQGQTKVVKVIKPADSQKLKAEFMKNTAEKKSLMRMRDQQLVRCLTSLSHSST